MLRRSTFGPLLAALLAVGCRDSAVPDPVTLATTTSTRDSGLLDVLVPMFHKQTGIEVKVVAVGSGQAIQLGERGDADVLLTHAPAAEQQFVDDGFGIERAEVMHNDFVVVGPAEDPAGVKDAETVAEAFAALAEAEATFISRGDDSGTHRKERAIWKAAQRQPAGDWYVEAGAGMGAALRMAQEKRAYTLSDRATFLATREETQLAVAFEGDPLLLNRYSVMIVNPAKNANVNVEGARALARFLSAPKTREVIAAFGVEKFGRPLFVPKEG